MAKENEHIQALEEIKQMMDRGSRFVSLSGWSGIAAGICALAAAGLTGKYLNESGISGNPSAANSNLAAGGNFLQLHSDLLILAVTTFMAAFFSLFFLPGFEAEKQAYRSGVLPPAKSLSVLQSP
jgi:hypothetical protein